MLHIPVRGGATRGRYAIVEGRSRPADEPPPHVHGWEDEVFRVVEGAAEFFCGRERLAAGAGDTVIVPAGAPHAFRILAPEVRMIVTVASVDARPVGLDRYFLAMSGPAACPELPAPGATIYATDAGPARTARLAAEHGTRFLTAEETRGPLPGYPGFSASRGQAPAGAFAGAFPLGGGG